MNRSPNYSRNANKKYKSIIRTGISAYIIRMMHRIY